jgi:hypothetical protein
MAATTMLGGGCWFGSNILYKIRRDTFHSPHFGGAFLKYGSWLHSHDDSPCPVTTEVCFRAFEFTGFTLLLSTGEILFSESVRLKFHSVH